MCIAITSPIGVSIPTDDILKTCFRNNDDGAGFAFNTDNNKVQIVKGFMDFDSFIAAIHEYDKKYGFKDRGVLIHFRITTHGGTKPNNCHPFPISNNPKHLKKLKITSNYAVVHNGIIRLCADSKNELSDTMLFIKDYLSKLNSNKDWFHNKNNINLIEQLIGSKMAILNADGKILATSGFHKGEDGNYYSNYSYQEYDYGIYRYGFFDDGWYSDYYSYANEGQHEMPLMELKRGECIYYDDGTTEEYRSDYHNLFKTYVTEDNEVYALFDDGDYDDKIPMEHLTYIGNGAIIDNFFTVSDSGYNIAKFRKDAVAII